MPAGSPYTVTVANAATFAADLGVVYAATGLPLTKVASAPVRKVGHTAVEAAPEPATNVAAPKVEETPVAAVEPVSPSRVGPSARLYARPDDR